MGGSEIAGAADMGGIEYFTTTCDTPDGDATLLELVMQEMNVPVDPTAEETKGGSGHVGKMILSASDKQLALGAYAPQEKADSLSAITWMEEMIKSFGGYGEIQEGSTQYKAIAIAKQDGEKGKYPLKLRDEAIGASIAFLKGKGLFPDKDDDDEDDYCFGDDDFPCDQTEEPASTPGWPIPPVDVSKYHEGKTKKVAKERKGGSGHVGKMILSASDKQLALVAYVPEEKAGSLSAITWMEEMIKAFGDY